MDSIFEAGRHSGNPAPIKPIPTIVPTPTEYETLHDAGQNTLWVVFVIMLVASGIFALRSWSVPISRRLFHVVTTIITITAALSYFAMASGDANSFACQTVADNHSKHIPSTTHDVCRQVFWARYVDWAITTPLLILDLSMLAGISGGHTVLAIFADLIMVLTGLFAAYGKEHTAQKWGWYTIGCIAYLFVVWHLAVNGRRAVAARGDKTTKLFGSLALLTLVLWTAYPIIWGIADGSRMVSVDTEILCYAVLDVLAKVGFGAWLLIAHRTLPETHLEVGGYWANGLGGGEGRIRIGEDDA